MKRGVLRPVGIAVFFAAILLVVFTLTRSNPTAKAQNSPVVNNILARALQVELGTVQPLPHQQRVSSGVIYALLEATGELGKRADAHPGNFGSLNPPASATGGCPNRYVGNGTPNIRVNQDCSLRRQAEEVIAINPLNSNNMIVGANDSRIGNNHCGYAWSFDGGNAWGDQVPPFYQFTLGDGHTADACSDPTASFDSAGNAYVAGVLFDIVSPASAFVVAKSNNSIGGRFYHTPKALSFQTSRTSPLGVVASDNNPNIFNDKEFIVADSSAGSPKSNNVYATWTRFAVTGAGVGANSPIYFSQSADGGATWSAGIEISGASAAACTAFNGEANPNACDQDQGSHPVVGADGTIYVSFGNGNTPNLGINQHMVVTCAYNKDCTQSGNWTAPVRIALDYGTQPIGPNAATACPAGRQCLPPNGYRIDDFTFGSLSVDSHGTVYHVFSDFRNGGGSCSWANATLGQAAVATPPCDQDVFYSYSKDGGATWSTEAKLTPPNSAQWMPWSAVVPDGSTLWVSYYDRSYGNCEFTGCNDITMAQVNNPASKNPSVKYTRITSSSMPNMAVADNPLQAGFLGDYMWLAVDNKGRPNVVWADTRGLGGTVESDIYFASLP